MLVSQLNFRKKSALRETRVRPSLESDLRHSALVAYVGEISDSWVTTAAFRFQCPQSSIVR